MSDPVPQRIGDAERDRAVEYLREHLAQGRLDQTEFDERLDTALTARTAADLEPLFADLPAPKPGNAAPPSGSPWPAYPVAAQPAQPPAPPAASAPPAVRDQAATGLAIAASVAWPVWFIAMFALNAWGWLWWTVFIPIAISSLAGQRFGHGRHRDRDRRRQIEE